LPYGIELTAPRTVAVAEHPAEPLPPTGVRVRTLYSGLSAGTELATFRATSPYLNKTWDKDRRIFVPGGPTLGFPVSVWGYSEVGRVVECGEQVAGLSPGDVVWGIWGHRSEAVLEAGPLADHVLPPATPPLHGVFARVGAVALNAVFAAEVRMCETVAIFGQGVIGLIATQLARAAGAHVLAVDLQEGRLRRAAGLGATPVRADDPAGAGAAVREHTGGAGADVAIELSGSYQALHEAIRCVGADGLVAAAGFYQGEAHGLSLGEEFHHNRVRVVASQIGGVPTPMAPRWTPARLHTAFMGLVQSGQVEAGPLVSHVVPATYAQYAYDLLDRADPSVLQVVLSFDEE
jgi:2-desacetyl-2-hydroxyethyl bacteriochlorophyllide A dehydrogenase